MGNRISAFLLVILMGLLWVGCGGGGSGSGENESVQSLLKETFSGAKTVKSGVVGLSFSLNGKGGGLNGPVTFKLGGPFASQGAGRLPKFQLGLNAQAQGQSFSAGATSTGDKAFVNFRGTDYLVDDNTFKAVKAAYEQAQTQANGKKQNPSLGTLGINPSAWLTNPKNEGSAKVGNDDAIKITGGVNVGKLLDDINRALQKASQLGLGAASGGNVPSSLTPAERKQVTDAVKDVKVEIYTGKTDRILREMKINLDINPVKSSAGSLKSATIIFDLTFTDVNKGQTINAPSKTKPFSDLVGSLGGLLGGTTGAGSSGSSGLGTGAGSGSGSSGGVSTDALDKYSSCVKKAGKDTVAAQKCLDLLTTP